jgi:uncharacterized RDD family membrane protein YckC
VSENDVLATSWSRFWSRTLDINLYSIPLSFFLVTFYPEMLLLPDGQSVDIYVANFLLMPLILTIDVLCLSIFGNTIGRKLAGIRVEMSDGGKVDLATGFSRNFRIYVCGFAMGIPLINILTLISQYITSKKGKLASWDEELDTRVVSKKGGVHRTLLCAFLVFVNVAVWAAVNAVATAVTVLSKG